MKTIKLITECIELMKVNNLPANISIGTFKVESSGHLINWAGSQGEYTGSNISFRIKFRPDHIQNLMDMGVKIDLKNCVMADLSPKALRFKSGREAIKQGRYAPYYYMGNPENKQTGGIENWLEADAYCTPEVLTFLDRYCRDNHRGQIAIDNDTELRSAGWHFKQNIIIENNNTDFQKHIDKVNAIRKAARRYKYEHRIPQTGYGFK